MSEERALLAETLERLFRDTPVSALWQQLDELGLPLLLVPEAGGGAGGCFEDAFVVARALGRFAVPLPLCEALLAARLLAAAGIPRPPGAISLALHGEGELHGGRFSGLLEDVPWGAEASGIVTLLAQERVVLLTPAVASAVEHGANLAEEPRDRLRFDAAPAATAAIDATAAGLLYDHAALLRTGQIAGALAAALERSIAHASRRTQFGRTLAQFQAVQQQLAVMGEEVMAVECAAGAASRAADRGDAGFEIACARLRANLAIESCTATAHQIHGAIGFTHEQDLRLFTQRLLAWRSELGNDLAWSARLGRAVAARGADAFWPELTARSDPRPASRPGGG